MRKLTPEERLAKREAQAQALAEAHIHTADCGHLEAPAKEAPVVEAPAEEAPAEEAPAEEDKPKRGRRKAEATEEAPAEESEEA